MSEQLLKVRNRNNFSQEKLVFLNASPYIDIEVNGTSYGEAPPGMILEVEVTDGTNPVTPDAVSLSGNILTIAVPKDLSLYAPYSSGDTNISFTIITGSDGTITSADTTGLTSVTYDINGSPATIPFSLSVVDVLTIGFAAAGADGVVILTGTYA